MGAVLTSVTTAGHKGPPGAAEHLQCSCSRDMPQVQNPPWISKTWNKKKN